MRQNIRQCARQLISKNIKDCQIRIICLPDGGVGLHQNGKQMLLGEFAFRDGHLASFLVGFAVPVALDVIFEINCRRLLYCRVIPRSPVGESRRISNELQQIGQKAILVAQLQRNINESAQGRTWLSTFSASFRKSSEG